MDNLEYWFTHSICGKRSRLSYNLSLKDIWNPLKVLPNLFPIAFFVEEALLHCMDEAGTARMRPGIHTSVMGLTTTAIKASASTSCGLAETLLAGSEGLSWLAWAISTTRKWSLLQQAKARSPRRHPDFPPKYQGGENGCHG